MTTRQAQIAHWHGNAAAFGYNFIEEIDATCPHDVGIFIGYDAETGEQLWKCHQCGEVSTD